VIYFLPTSVPESRPRPFTIDPWLVQAYLYYRLWCGLKLDVHFRPGSDMGPDREERSFFRADGSGDFGLAFRVGQFSCTVQDALVEETMPLSIAAVTACRL
jgi:hypothetical protein